MNLNFDDIYWVIMLVMLKSRWHFLGIVRAYYFKQGIAIFPINKNKLVLLVASLEI